MLLDNLKKDPLIKILLVLILGLFFLDFFFALVFGNQNVMYRYMGITNLFIDVLSLVLVGALFYGIYKLFKEYAGPYLLPIYEEDLKPLYKNGIKPFYEKEIKPVVADILVVKKTSQCPKCQCGLEKGWNCCPYCGSDVNSERS